MDFSELFTQSARDVLPLARSKQLISYFDCRGPLIDVGGQDPNLLRAGIHRLLLGVTDCLLTGFVLFVAEVEPPHHGRSRVRVHAAGTGTVRADDLRRVLRRLDLEAPAARDDGSQPIRRAEGACPATGGHVVFVDAGAEGLDFALDVTVAAVEVPGADPLPDAAGVEAWLVSAIPHGLDSVHRRLRRHGWRVSSFETLAGVTDRVAARRAAGTSGPLLLIVAERTGHELEALGATAAASPALRTVLAVVSGSPAVHNRGATPVDIRVLPLSPLELDRITAQVDWRTSTAASRETSPAPLYAHARRCILVVDDSEVNRLIADGLLDVLGYDVSTAADGAQALVACRSRPPDMVLMDVDMPIMDGLEATVRLRAWQQVGTVPPFPIVAATSADDDARRNACQEAGMDGYLAKPLVLDVLADELRRVLPTRPVEMNGGGTADDGG